MQPFRRGCQTRPKAVLCPICWPQQNDAGALHEQRAQIAIATLADTAKYRPVACGHLLRHQAEPGGKVASFGKGSSIGNGRDHRTRDEGADARNGHQLPATLALARQHFDLLGNLLDALIETSPIAAELLDDPDHAGRQNVDALGQNLRELLPQKTKSLAHSNAALQEEATDLVDHSRPLAD